MIPLQLMKALEEKLSARLHELNEALLDSADALDAVKLDQTSVGRLSRMDCEVQIKDKSAQRRNLR